jgi:methionine-rich copper-binding protein CopC
MRFLSTTVSLALLLLVGSVTVHAHALLDRADPRVGSTVSVAPREILLSFSQYLEPAFSTVEVTDASGRRVDEGEPTVDGKVMRIRLQAIPPGTYRVKWRVLSVDTHTTEGAFSFEVRP